MLCFDTPGEQLGSNFGFGSAESVCKRHRPAALEPAKKRPWRLRIRESCPCRRIAITPDTNQAEVAENYCLEICCAGHSFSMVLIEVMVNVTEDGEPVLAKASELVLIEGDSFPVTSTCCPRYLRSFVLPVA